MRQKSDPPVASHFRKSKEVVDFLKYVGLLIIGLMAFGWMGRAYIDEFQTDDEAEARQDANDLAHERAQAGIDANSDALDGVRVHNIRIELEQRSTNDRLDQLLELQTAETRAERREAMGRVEELQDRIDRRERVIRSPAALKRVSERVADDPLAGLEGL